jgi:hypothetical protein
MVRIHLLSPKAFTKLQQQFGVAEVVALVEPVAALAVAVVAVVVLRMAFLTLFPANN